LRRPASEISLLDLIEAVEGPTEPASPASHGLTPGTQARMSIAMEELTGVCRRQLKSLRIASMLANPTSD
jgi:DNA-binding IscR family transcriptional regulator